MNLDYQETPFTNINDIVIPPSFFKRIKTQNQTIDNFFTGGLVPGMSFTITGAQGIGKSTSMLTILSMLAKQGFRVGVCSSEEILYQVAFTCQRLGIDNIEIANISNVDRIAEALKIYDVVIVDSFQGLTHPLFEGKVRAIEKYAVEKLYVAAKMNETVLGFVCHVTKGGDIKGGTVVTHTVDMNMEIEQPFEHSGDRIINITKNRFGEKNSLNCYLSPTGFIFEENGVEAPVLEVICDANNSNETPVEPLLEA